MIILFAQLLQPEFPAWASTDEAKAFFLGFAAGASVRIFRAGLRWAKNVGDRNRGE